MINDICGGGGSVIVCRSPESDGDQIYDSDDEDEDDNHDGVTGRDSPVSPSSMTLMPNDEGGARKGVMLPQHSPPLTPSFTVLPPGLGGESFHGSIFASAGMESEDSIMADSCVDAEGCDSGYESALDGGKSCQLAASDANLGNRRCESPQSDVGGDDYEALYQQLKTPVERIGGGWQRWVTPHSSCGEMSSPCESDEEMLRNMTGHSGMVVAAQREARGRMKRSGGKNMMGGGQKMGKVRKERGGGKKVWRKRCGDGHAGVHWVS